VLAIPGVSERLKPAVDEMMFQVNRLTAK
jgi:hypothetical protein